MYSSAVLVLAIWGIGLGLSGWIDVPLRFEERLPIGLVLGTVAVVTCTFVAFELVGMGWTALGAGVLVPAVPAALGVRRSGSRLAADARDARRRLGLGWRDPRSSGPFVLAWALSVAVTTRILALAYQQRGRQLFVGHLSGYGDWAAHLAYAGSFAYGDNRAFETPLASGTPLRYHVFANFAGSVFTVPGTSLTRALVWTSWMIAITIVPLLAALVLRLTGDRAVALLATVVFLLAGGLGWWYAIGDVQDGGWRTLTALPQTYARMPDQGIWLDNTIGASLYAQRATLYGLAIGATAAILLLAARPTRDRRAHVVAGVLIGLCGIVHVHVLVTALALAALALVVERRRSWWWFLGPALAIGVPLAWAIRPPTSRMRWLPGWMAPQSDQLWIWFWLRNAGLLLVLALIATLVGGASRRLVLLLAPLWLWFVVPNLVSPHPWEGNNTKFFLFWQFGAAILAADLLVRAWRPPGRTAVLRRGAVVAAVLVLVAAGGLDTLRAMQRSSAIGWVDDDEVVAARWLRAEADRGDVLVYGATNTSAVAALSGVPAVSGYAGWTDDLGLPDAIGRSADSARILQGAAETDDLLAEYGVDWVVIGPRERWESGASDAYWDARATLRFARGDYRIYEV